MDGNGAPPAVRDGNGRFAAGEAGFAELESAFLGEGRHN